MATPTAKLWLPVGTNNSFLQALSIPLDDFQHFSLAGIAWLRYVAFTIHGREGHISSTHRGTEIKGDEDIEAKNYYYISQESALWLDPDLMDDRTSIATAESTNQGDFKQRVIDRDKTCVLTGAEENNIACHIVPHAKTHKYMVNLANYRGQDLDPPLDNIDDTRNGILLYSAFHRAFGKSQVAFLRTPNFAMAITDVDRVAQPDVILQPLGTKRVTFQHFNTNDRNLVWLAPHNCDATIADSGEWPPDLFFDVAYGCAALAKWGTRSFIQFARRETHKIYYDEGVNGDDTNGLNPPQQTTERAAGQETAEVIPDFHDIILGLWMRNGAKKDQHTANTATVDRTKKEIQEWLDSVV